MASGQREEEEGDEDHHRALDRRQVPLLLLPNYPKNSEPARKPTLKTSQPGCGLLFSSFYACL